MDNQNVDEPAPHIPFKLDEQHKALLMMFNDLHSRVELGKGEGNIVETLQGLQEYVAVHFADEEQLMQEGNYDGLEEHKALHREFEVQLNVFCKQSQDGGLSLELEVIEFLRSWIVNHIEVADSEAMATLNLPQAALQSEEA